MSKDVIELLQKIYKDRIEIEKSDQIFLDGEYVFDPKETIKEEFELQTCESKKEIYDKLLRLSKLYLSLLKNKKQREILKEIIPSVEKVVSSFFDVSKYCSDEHIFDDFSVKDMTYDKLLVLFPKMIANLKARRKEQKKEEFKHFFENCKTLEECYNKIEELKKNKEMYQEVCNTLNDFFDFYNLSKNEFDVSFSSDKFTYDNLFEMFLQKTIDLKKSEIERENKEYHLLLDRYQKAIQSKTILEVTPQYLEIANKDATFKKEKMKVVKGETQEQEILKKIKSEIHEWSIEKEQILSKNFIIRFFYRGKLKKIQEQLEKLQEEKRERERKLDFIISERNEIIEKIVQNERNLIEICGFNITVLEFDRKRKASLNAGETKEELEKVVEGLTNSLMQYHIEQKEEELERIMKKHHVSNSLMIEGQSQ